ncbi:MAG: MFS transporter [Dehalococcoidia bacterium]|nr:MFS transporter [Dehalococcoidia bacterium]
MPSQEVPNLSPGEKPRFFYGYVVVLVAFFIMVLMFGTFYTFGVFFKPLSAEFGWARATTSGAFSLAMFLSGLLAIVMGRLTDRFGSRIVMTICGFLLGLGYLLMSQVSAIWQLYLFYGVVIGMGMGGCFVPMLSTVARWFVNRRGMMTGFVVAGIGTGTIIIPLVASWLISSYGWRVSYIWIGAIALVFIIVAAQFLRHDPRQIGQLPYGENEVKEESLNLPAGGFSLRQATGTRQLWMLFTTLFCFGFCLGTIMVHVAPHATELGISATMAASILAVIGGLSIVGRIVMGSVADRIGNKPPLIINFVMVSGVLFWLVVAKELWMLYLFAAIFGFAYGGVVVLESPLIAELFGLSSHGVILGIVAFGYTVGGAVGPILAGRIFDIIGSYQVAFLICAVLGILGIILASLLKPSVSKGGEGDSGRSA